MAETASDNFRVENAPDVATYRIQKPFRIAVATDLVLLFILMALSIFFVGSATERIALAVIFFLLLAIGIEAFQRKVSVGREGVVLLKFFRKKELRWNEITALGCVSVRKKIYFLLTTTKGFHILSNAYERYPEMVRRMVDQLGSEKVEREVLSHVEQPLWNRSDLVSVWLAAVVLTGLIALKFLFK